MARPREFDPEVAMTQAMELFWNVGFEEATLSKLLKSMKITKGSFYKAFQDKKSVYLQALDRYDATVVSGTVSFLGDPENGTGRERIRALFQRVESSAQTDGDRMGCFLCNAMVDKAAEGGEAEVKIQAMVGRLERAFHSALVDECSSPDRLEDAALAETAKGLLSIYFGMRVLGRAGLAASMAGDCVRQAERLISAALSEAGGQAPAAN
ncbi:MAG: TetR/AcrR family transcriptional regulator [Roseibium sp.]